MTFINKQWDSKQQRGAFTMKKKERLVRNFLTAVSCRLKCPICYDVFAKPRRLFCGHTFCKPCLQQLCSSEHHKDPQHILSCPLCRTPLQPRLIDHDKIAINIINDLQVACPVFGCPWQGKCKQLQQHHQKCPMRAIVEEEIGTVEEVVANERQYEKQPQNVVSILSEDEEESIALQQLELPQRVSAEEYFYQEVRVQKKLLVSRGMQTIHIPPIDVPPPEPPKRRRRRRRFSKEHNKYTQNGSIAPRIRRKRRTKKQMQAMKNSMKEEPLQPLTQQEQLRDIEEIYNSMGFNFYQEYEQVNKVKKRLVVNVDIRPEQITQRW